jgi:meiotically up-regulated gene 157 (Mug157) protein
VATRDYELDSGCYWLRLLYKYWRLHPDADIVRHKIVRQAVASLVALWWLEQRHEEDRAPEWGWWPFEEYRYPTLARRGRGPSTKYTGMSWTAARPSDDPAERSFLIPSNAFAVVELHHAAELAEKVWGETSLARVARRLASEIDQGMYEHPRERDRPRYV